MRSEVTLVLNEATGNERLIVVTSKRFTIGRSADNDLAIDNSSLSRRHALIEIYDGLVQLSDCGSQNGTSLNGAGIGSSAVLQDGDIITLGGVCDLTVRIRNDGDQIHAGAAAFSRQAVPKTAVPKTAVPQIAKPYPSSQGGPRSRQEQAQFDGNGWFSVPVLAAGGIALILLVSGLLLFLTKKSDPKPARRTPVSTETTTNVQQGPTDTTAADDNQANANDTAESEVSASPLADAVEKAAVQVMHRASSDDKNYSFSEKSLHDIQQRVQEYRNVSSLPAALATLQRSSSSLAAQARHGGIEPGLLIYAALAETDGGRAGADPVATARAILPDLLALRATFGINDADSSLILIAAYKMGKGEKRSHPLLATMRRIAKNPFTQRNVWYLHDKGGLDERSYNFVLSFLALGVISQNPRQFGIPSNPLSF